MWKTQEYLLLYCVHLSKVSKGVMNSDDHSSCDFESDICMYTLLIMSTNLPGDIDHAGILIVVSKDAALLSMHRWITKKSLELHGIQQ